MNGVHMPALGASLRIAVALSLACSGGAAAAAVTRRACMQDCRLLQRACLDDARGTLAAGRAFCDADQATRRSCRRGERRTFRDAKRACKRDTKQSCRPCCRQGGLNECRRLAGVTLLAEPQVTGDASRGRELLFGGDFMTCGVPKKLWDAGFDAVIATGYGGSADAPRLPERTGSNADLPYFLTAFTSPTGAEVINGNCLMCHGGLFDGELVIGLGNATADFTQGAGGGVPSTPIPDEVLATIGLDQIEIAAFKQIADRAAILAPVTRMPTVGMNPAELLAIVLMVHHDRDTLAWSETELIPFDLRDHDGMSIPNPIVTSDPPPWWRVHKKNALFYNGMARGDHRGTMALATSVCVDSVTRAAEVDAMFQDIQAFVRSLRAPKYPRAIDGVLAAEGAVVFGDHCATCHGTYAERDEDETYPNLLIPLDVVRTDPVVAELGVVHAPELVDWYNGSFYGDVTQMAPNDPFPGYMPPPLDGIWATAPYLHNGSVPTIALVLDSRARPARWRRVDFDSTHFDEDALGWPWEAVAAPADGGSTDDPLVYDTTGWSRGNGGHPFGDHLTDDERRAVLEYLKTL